MTPEQLEADNAARTIAAYAFVRATLARDHWTMTRILHRWARGPKAIEFTALVGGAACTLIMYQADRDRPRALELADNYLDLTVRAEVPRATAV